ncbi:hypothetical protein DRO54_07250 [Candidatus Bathyarchaeota archaeon]|nr:MAG: hypothetical protein DRO54_07250 [Candidatus Bathyarchaeota archaeon]
MKEKHLLFTFVAGFVLGRVIFHTESLALRMFALFFAFIIATACACAYAEEKEINAVPSKVKERS